MPFSKIQRISAASAEESGTTAAYLTRQIGALGASGKYTRNLRRDLTRLVARDFEMALEPTMVMTPTSRGTVAWPVFPPHELIHCLNQAGDVARKVLIGSESIEQFWREFSQDPLLDPPALAAVKEAMQRGHWPIRLHGDEGQWSGRDRGIMIMSISSLNHTATAYDSRLLLFVRFSAQRQPGVDLLLASFLHHYLNELDTSGSCTTFPLLIIQNLFVKVHVEWLLGLRYWCARV
jgi:hypothetical protein